MQNTLLTLGIAIILALVAALVGPAVVDWEQYHAEVEEQASAVVGVPVRVRGAIDVRLLPTPSVTLGDVEIGPSGSKVSARGLAMELTLGSLMSGEIHASQVTLDRPEFHAGLDRSGALQVPGLALSVDPDRVAIERLSVTDGRIVLSDAASGGQVTIEDLNASGEVSSLIGPFKLEGAFTARGGHYGYRISGGRRDDDGSMKVRLVLADTERALDFQSDGTLWFDGALPRFEGQAALSPVAGTTDARGRAVLADQWRVSAGQVKASASAVEFGKLEISWGPEAHLVRINGEARLGLGREPRLAATVTTRQIDFDRVLPGGDGRRSPFETVRFLVDRLAEAGAPPLPVHAVVAADNVLAGGATVSSLRADLESGGGGWTLNRFEMRAPGATQITVGGKLRLGPGQEEFQGPVTVDSGDPVVFSAWIEGRGGDAAPLGPLRGSGTVTLGRERIAVDGLRAELDRRSLQGRVAYRFATAAAPARLEAALNGTEFDFDRVLGMGSALFTSTSFDRPGEVALALDIDRASLAGVPARKAQATLTYDRSGLKIDRLSIADIGGASVDASGRLDSAGGGGNWRGALDLAVAAPTLEGMIALADRFLPADWKAGDALRRWGPRTTPLKLSGRFEVEPPPTAAGRTAARLRLNGTVAGSAAAIEVSGTGDVSDPAAAAVVIGGRLDAPDGRALASLTGLDAVATPDSRPARLTFMVDGAAGKTFTVDARFNGPDLYAGARGTMAGASQGTLAVELRTASARLPRRAGSPAVPADLHARVAVNGSEIAVTDLTGRIASASVKGAVTVGTAEPLRINGEIAIDQADAGELFAILAGAPRTAPSSQEWIAEPFGPPAAPAMDGRVAFRIATAQWSSAAAPAKDVAGTVRFDPAGFAVAGTTGTLAGGRFALEGELRRDRAGVSLHSRLKLDRADMPGLLGGVLRVPSAGRLSLDLDVRGQGLSPASLVGSASGAGALTVENLELGGLDPNAPDAVLAALESDRGLTANAPRLLQVAGTALDAGRLKIATVSTPVTIANGSAQLGAVQASAQNTDVSGTVSVDLADWQANGRFVMTAAARRNAPGTDRPVMTVTARGPLTAARRSVDVASLVTWATQRAIDQETRRLDEVEKERRRVESALDATRRHQEEAARPPDPVRPVRPGVSGVPLPPALQQGTPAQGSAADRRLRPSASGAPTTGP